MEKFQKLQINSLDKKFAKFKAIELPKAGWINTIRSSLSMTLEQLAKRIDVSTPAVIQFEKSEVEETITLKTLKKVAEGLNCKLSYVLIPQDNSLNKVLKKQANKKARKMVKNVDNHMALEKQQVKNSAGSVKILAKELLENYNSKIWNDG